MIIRRLFVLLAGILWSATGLCDSPTVALTYPPANVTILKALSPSILLQATAADADENVASVYFYACLAEAATCDAPDTAAGTAQVSPYQVTWTPPLVPGSSSVSTRYLVWAMAVNSSGQWKLSAKVPIMVIQPAPAPKVKLVAPSAPIGFTAPAAPVLYATASPGNTTPSSTIVRVDFLDGQDVIGTVASPNSVPTGYAYTWSNPALGPHQITARATDTLGDSSTSAPVTIYIFAADQAPQITLTSPGSGQTFNRASAIPLAATAIPGDRAIQRVEFVAGNNVIATAFALPYRATWVGPPPGNYAILARAFDDLGVAVASPAAYVWITDGPRRPAVVMTAPAPGSIVSTSSPLPLAADALAPDGAIGRVDFYAGSTMIGSAPNAPYNFTWPKPGLGAQSLTAKAYDLQGRSAVSTAVGVTVSGGTAPEISLNAPSAGTTYAPPATIALAATASATSGRSVTKVDFFANGILIGTRTASPYSFTWQNVGAGSYALTAKIKDSLGASATTPPVGVTVASPGSPTATLTSPATGAWFALGQSVPITAQVTASGRTLERVDFYVDGSKAGSVTFGANLSSGVATFSNSAMSAGAHTISAKVFATDGAAAPTQTISISISDLAVALIEPFPQQVYQAPGQIWITADATETGGTVAQLDFFGDGALIGSAYTVPYSIAWNGVAAGTHTVTARVRSTSGISVNSGPISVGVVTTPALQLDPGIDGASIPDDSVTISGSVTAPANSAVVVNGQAATLDRQGRFSVDGIRLRSGSNSLTIVLNTTDGEATSKSVIVNSTATGSFIVELDRQEGFAPFTTMLRIFNRANLAFKRIDIDFNSDGTPEQTITAVPAGGLGETITYPAPGLYTLRVTVYDASNVVLYSGARKVRVYDPAELGWKVVGVYKQLLGRLSLNDLASAVNLFTGPAQTVYSDVLANLGVSLPTVAAQMGTIVDGVVSDDFAELTLARDTAQGRQAFVIHFVRGSDGIWRIESM